jgi:hypothetical protein
MFSYWFKEKVIDKLDKFIDSYSESFLKLFRDSWITNKYIIEENYIKKSEKLKNDILLEIDNIFHNSEELFWFSFITIKKKYISKNLKNYKIKIFYIENKIKKERIIYDLEFHKR